MAARRRRRRRAVGAVRGLGQEPVSGRRRPQRARLQVLLPVQEVPLQARARAAAELGQWQRAGGERAGRLRRRVAGRPPRPSGKSRKISRPNGPGRLPGVGRLRHRQGRGRRRAPGAAARPAGRERPGGAPVLAQGPGPGRPVGQRRPEVTRTRSRRGWSTRRRPASPPPCAGCPRFPASGEGWPGRLLGEYAQLHLLARAHQRLADLPPDLAATVRSRIGYPTSRADVLARPAVTDRWAVLAVRDLLDGKVPGRRLWLRGRDERPVGDAAHVRRPRRGGRGRRLAGPGHGPAEGRDRAAREPALLPRPARAAGGRGGAAGRPGAGPAAARGRRRRRPAGRVRRRPGTRSLADRLARPADRHSRSRPTATGRETAGG